MPHRKRDSTDSAGASSSEEFRSSPRPALIVLRPRRLLVPSHRDLHRLSASTPRTYRLSNRPAQFLPLEFPFLGHPLCIKLVGGLLHLEYQDRNRFPVIHL